jgi:hypothetical protein
MTTAKQTAANRPNAQRSTGPRTPAGKAASSRNALRHGLRAPEQVRLPLAGQTPRKAVAGALEVLNRVRANTIGLVLNQVTSDLSDSYYYYGYYGKYYKYYRHYKSA